MSCIFRSDIICGSGDIWTCDDNGQLVGQYFCLVVFVLYFLYLWDILYWSFWYLDARLKWSIGEKIVLHLYLWDIICGTGDIWTCNDDGQFVRRLWSSWRWMVPISSLPRAEKVVARHFSSAPASWKDQGEMGCCAGAILCVSGFSSSIRNRLRVMTHPSPTQHFSPSASWKDQGENGCCAGEILFDNRHYQQTFFSQYDSEFREKFRQQTLSELAKTINIICSFVVRGVKIGVVGS